MRPSRSLVLAGVVLSALLSAMGLHVRSGQAQETMQFKPVPRESVSSYEERMRAQRAKRSAARNPAPPSTPATPSVPSPPPDLTTSPRNDVIISKSGDIMRIGSDIHVARDQVVTGDLMAVGGDITVDGHVEGDVVVMGGDLQLGSTARVDGDAVCIGGELTEDPGASIGGQRVTAGGLRHFRGVRGHAAREAVRSVAAVSRVGSSMVWLFICLLVAWGFTALAPGRTGAALEMLKGQPAMSLGIGALVWALLIPSIVALCLVVAILCITIIGIPLALAALLGYFVFLGLLWVWGYVVTAVAVGGWVVAKTRRQVVASSGTEIAAGGPTASLTRRALLGVLVISGSGTIGRMLQTLFFVPPLQGLGTFISVCSIVAGGLAATFGGGAWLRAEWATGTLGRWWRGRRPAASPPASTTSSPVAGTPVAEPTPPPSQAPPAPPAQS